MKLADRYTTSALINLLRVRYGLNPLGIKTILKIDTKRYIKLLKAKDDLNMEESLRIVSAFEELVGKFSYAVIIVKG